MNTCGYYPPYGCACGYLLAHRYRKTLLISMPPYNSVCGLCSKRPVYDGYITCKNSGCLPLAVFDAKQKSTGSMSNKQLVQVQAAQAFIGCRIRKPGVHRHAVVVGKMLLTHVLYILLCIRAFCVYPRAGNLGYNSPEAPRKRRRCYFRAHEGDPHVPRGVMPRLPIWE